MFGGRNYLGHKNHDLNDLYYLDELTNKWHQVNTTGSVPPPRHGHIMFCYYEYLVIYGGQTKNNDVLGDLWLFDTEKETWHLIMDSNDVHSLARHNVTGIVPTARTYAAGEVNHRVGNGFIVGGKTGQHKPACDMWVLNIDKMVEFVEQPHETIIENIWRRKELKEEDDIEMCRWGHTTGFVNARYMFIYGGVNLENHVVRNSFLYDMLENSVLHLEEVGEKKPALRLSNSNLLEAGNGMMTLYGGEDPSRKGHFTDLWHLKIKLDKVPQVEFTKIEYKKGSHAHQILSWRQGFTLHYLKSQNDPVMVGGTFGNHQESQIMFILPEDKCANAAEFDAGKCVPCPMGSLYDSFTKECQWCKMDQYFDDDPANFFESQCKICPTGTRGGYEMECLPCPAGHIFDEEAKF